MIVPVAHVVNIVTFIARVRWVKIHKSLRAVITINAVPPIQIFNNDCMKALINRLKALFQRFKRSNQTVSMPSIGNAGLESRVIEFATPASHNEIVKSVGTLNIIELSGV